MPSLTIPQRPQRRWTIEIKSGGDTWEDALRLLREMADHIEEHGQGCDFTAGGSDSGGFIKITEDHDMTHARYHALLDSWLAFQKTADSLRHGDGGRK